MTVKRIRTVSAHDVLGNELCEACARRSEIRKLFRRRRLSGEQVLDLPVRPHDRLMLVMSEPLLTHGQVLLLAADCVERALSAFEAHRRGDVRPHRAIDVVRRFVRNEVSGRTLSGARRAAFSAARACRGSSAGNAAYATVELLDAARCTTEDSNQVRRQLKFNVGSALGHALRAAVAARAQPKCSVGGRANVSADAAAEVAELEWRTNRARAYLRGEI